MSDPGIFSDRTNAGIELGKLLQVEYKDRHALVLGIPRGGVHVAYHAAKVIQADLSVIGCKKLPFPGHEELAFGAVAEDGSVFLTALSEHLDKKTITEITDKHRKKIYDRAMHYREGRPIPMMFNRLVILVNDGIVTGVTLIPALKLCRAKGAAKIVVATPVAGNNYLPEIASLADEVKIVEQVEDAFCVGQAYDSFPHFTHDDVCNQLAKFQKLVAH